MPHLGWTRSFSPVPRSFVAVALAVAAFVATVVAPAAVRAANRPNVLFVIADDQSPFDLSIYDPGTRCQTPVIAALAERGMVLDGAYHMGSWSGAVCTPSRHMVMSGRTVWHIPDRRGRGPLRNPVAGRAELVPPDLANHTLAAVFNRAGYDTMRTCKNGNSYEGANKQFTIRKDRTNRAGNDENGSAWHAEQVLDFLKQREATKDTDPFLVYYGFSHPHDPRYGKPDLLKKYGAVDHKDKSQPPKPNPKAPPVPGNWLPAHPFPHGHPKLRDEVSVSGVWERRDEWTIRNEQGREFACSENIDVQLGRVLDRLKEMGELDNTYVVYTADHGIAIGRHGLQGKQNLYEHTWRVPFIVAGPGIKPGTRARGNVYLLDVLATLCDLTGVEPPETNEGKSMKPVLFGEQETIRDTLYGVYCGGTKPGMRAVRKGDWKLVKYDVLDGSVRKTQLFNLADNPHEFLEQHHSAAVSKVNGTFPKESQRNLADDPAHAKKLAEMEALLLSEMQRHDDPFRLWNQPPLKPANAAPKEKKRPGQKTPKRQAGPAKSPKP